MQINSVSLLDLLSLVNAHRVLSLDRAPPVVCSKALFIFEEKLIGGFNIKIQWFCSLVSIKLKRIYLHLWHPRFLPSPVYLIFSCFKQKIKICKPSWAHTSLALLSGRHSLIWPNSPDRPSDRSPSVCLCWLFVRERGRDCAGAEVQPYQLNGMKATTLRGF